jgi:hypothetical protein
LLLLPSTAGSETLQQLHEPRLVQNLDVSLLPSVVELAARIVSYDEIVGVAADAGISLSHHSGRDLGVKTAAVLHAVSSTPAVNLPPDTVYYAYEDDIIESPFQFEDGALPVPDDPGLGVTVDEHKVESYRVEDYSMDWNG